MYIMLQLTETSKICHVDLSRDIYCGIDNEPDKSEQKSGSNEWKPQACVIRREG